MNDKIGGPIIFFKRLKGQGFITLNMLSSALLVSPRKNLDFLTTTLKEQILNDLFQIKFKNPCDSLSILFTFF